MRAPDRAIARINESGYGMDHAAGRTMRYVIYEGPQSLFVDDDGNAFCLPQGCSMQLDWIARRIGWWVGNFVVQRDGSLRQLIMADLRERVRELRAQAA